MSDRRQPRPPPSSRTRLADLLERKQLALEALFRRHWRTVGVLFAGGCVYALLGAAAETLPGAALVARKEQSLIGAVSFLQLPLTFLSTAFMQPSLMPDWISTLARYNPVDWAIRAGREAVAGGTEWAAVAGYCGLLALFASACLLLATRAFGAYQAQV